MVPVRSRVCRRWLPLLVVIGDFDVADLFDAVAVFGRIADDDVELPVSFEHRGCHRSTHGRLNDRVDVTGIEAVSRRFGAIHLDVQVRLAEDRKNSQIGNTANLTSSDPSLARPTSPKFQD